MSETAGRQIDEVLKALERLWPKLSAKLTQRFADLAVYRVMGGPDDFLQEVYKTAVTKVETFRPLGDLDTALERWAHGIADKVHKRAVERFYRFAKRVEEVAFEDARLDNQSPSRRASQAEFVAHFGKWLAGLKADDRTAFQLLFLDGMTYEEAAAKTGRTVHQINHLKKHLIKLVIESLVSTDTWRMYGGGR